MSSPRLAVAIPSYRRPELVLELTKSLPLDIPICISDNNSSLVGHTEFFGANVRIDHAAQLLPIFANWNRAVAGVPPDTTHVLIPSDDDLYLPDALAVIAAAISRYPTADMWVFGCDLVDEDGRRSAGWKPVSEAYCTAGDGFLVFEKDVSARMPGVMFSREFLDRIGGFDERFKLTAADSELIQRAALLGNTAFIPTVIGLYRVWAGSLTHARQATDLWMQEVALWTGKIAELLRSGHQPSNVKVDVDRYRDEIQARNLLAALNNLLGKGETAQARDFLRRHPVPSHSSLRTRLRLLRRRWRIWRGAA